MGKRYRFIDHTADFGLEIYGADPKDLFLHAAEALFDLIADPGALKGNHSRRLEIRGIDWADLMVNWLRELLYMFSGDHQLLCDLVVESIDQHNLTAVVTSVDYDPQCHDIRNEIKAVTYHQIEVGRHEKGWRAKVILDI